MLFDNIFRLKYKTKIAIKTKKNLINLSSTSIAITGMNYDVKIRIKLRWNEFDLLKL